MSTALRILHKNQIMCHMYLVSGVACNINGRKLALHDQNQWNTNSKEP